MTKHIAITDTPKSLKYGIDFSPWDPFIHRVDGVIFDLDGTLIINNEVAALDLIGDVFKDFLKAKHGITDKRCYRPYAGMGLDAIRRCVGEYYEVNIPASIEDDIFMARKKTPFPDEEVVVHPFFRGSVEYYHENNIMLRIATGGELDRAMRYIKAAGLAPFFTEERAIDAAIELCERSPNALAHYMEHGVDNWLFYSKKPNNRSYLQAIASMQRVNPSVSVQRVICYEDSVSGISAGHSSSVHSIGHQLATHLPTEKQSRINHHINLCQAGASAVIRNERLAVHAVECVLCQDVPERNPATTTTVFMHQATCAQH
ncbi:MAG: HAD family phosphatase [Proteobacteria bacterium]|jgi:beta-phosphoglucomutase-like phosphatase (HAD superfamily)|nr:hypothetical protein [Alphaproteobacteria bacterium]NCC03751.1 HAD family phosphatase [Pseudomonadota bacterium]